MASGAVVGLLDSFLPSPTDGAGPDTVTDTTQTPDVETPVFTFDSATAEYLHVFGLLHGYDGNGTTISWAAACSATSGVVCFEVAMARVQLGTTALTGLTLSSYTATSEVTVSGTADTPVAFSVSLSDGAAMGNVADGEAYVLAIRRKVSGLTGSNAAGDAKLLPSSLKIVEQ